MYNTKGSLKFIIIDDESVARHYTQVTERKLT